jgi:hypothetical protein
MRGEACESTACFVRRDASWSGSVFDDAKYLVLEGGPCDLLTESGRIARRIREPLACVSFEVRERVMC